MEFKTTRGLKNHVTQKHLCPRIRKKETIMCRFCSTNLKTKWKYAAHVKKIHSNIDLNQFIKRKPFECEQCQRRLGTKHAYDNHLKIHQGLKPFKCNGCQKSFRTLSSINDHIKIKHKETLKEEKDSLVSKEEKEEKPAETITCGCELSQRSIKSHKAFGSHQKLSHTKSEIGNITIGERPITFKKVYIKPSYI